MKTQGKGGRPIKGNSQKKGYRVNVKMATEEYYTLKAKARDAEMTYLTETIVSEVKRNGIKYRYINAANGITPENLYKLENIFNYNRHIVWHWTEPIGSLERQT